MISFLASLLDTLAKADASPPRAKRSDLIADVPVVDHFGKEHLFRRDLIAGRAVVIQTMFTICRGTCPGTSETLMRLRAPLSRLFGNRVTILSLSIDPHNDTPAALKDYSGLYGADQRAGSDQCGWHFLTGAPEHVDTLRRSLGFFDLNAKADADITQHASLLLFGNDATDRWGTSPAQLRDGLIFEPLRRILGVTRQERFGLRPI